MRTTPRYRRHYSYRRPPVVIEQNHKKKKTSKSNTAVTALLLLFLLIGVGLLVYPTFSDYWNSLHQSRAIAGYVEKVADLSNEDNELMWNQAKLYNASLLNRSNRYAMTDEEKEEYNATLDVTGTGIMGYVQISKISVSLPIYHGTDEGVLEIAIGHLEGTSLPVGGKGTHCVISGHRGLPSAKLFTDIDQLTEGDTFVLQVLNRTLTYEVDQIRTVLPYELDELDIDPDGDYCTLVTCTPYGVNSHRLLVRGHRTENEKVVRNVIVSADALQIDERLIIPFIAVPMIVLLFLVLFFTSPGGRKRR